MNNINFPNDGYAHCQFLIHNLAGSLNDLSIRINVVGKVARFTPFSIICCLIIWFLKSLRRYDQLPTNIDNIRIFCRALHLKEPSFPFFIETLLKFSSKSFMSHNHRTILSLYLRRKFNLLNI